MRKATLLFLLLLPFFSLAQIVDTAQARAEVDSLFKKVNEATKQRNFDLALSLINQAEENTLTAFGEISAPYALCLSYKGLVYYYQGAYNEVEKYWLEALAVRKKVLGQEHPDCANSLSNLGALYRTMGNYEKALTFHLEALTIRKKALGKEHSAYAESLNNLGILYGDIGNYEKADFFFLESLVIFEKIRGKENPRYADNLSNLGILYRFMGNYQKAESFHLQALAIREKVFGKEHPVYANSLTNLGVLYIKLGNYEKAESFHLQALAIEEKVFGKEHPAYAASLVNLGVLYTENGSFEKAESFHLQALAVKEKVFGKEHPDYANSLKNLGNLYGNMDMYEKGANFYLEAIAIEGKVMGKKRPNYADCLEDLGQLYFSLGDYEKARLFYLEGNEIQKSLLNEASHHLSEQELSAYIRIFTKMQNLLSSFVQMQPDLAGTIFNNTLFHKGFLLNAVQGANRLAQVNPASRELWLLHKSYLRRLAKEYAKPISKRGNVDTLEAKANELEKELTRTVAGYGEAIRQVEWPEVQAVLQKGEAAVEFIHYQYRHPNLTDSVMYVALVLRPGDEQPHFVPLFEEKALKSLLGSNKATQTQQLIAQVYTRGIVPKKKSQAEGLYQLIWRPLDSLLTHVQTIYASPSGLLHRINLGAIRIDSKQTLADKYRLSMLGSTRQLVINSQNSSTAYRLPPTATIYGGIRYDMDSTSMASTVRGETDDNPLSFSYLDRSSPERGRSWSYLPATAKEADKIRQIIQANGGQVQTFTGYAAKEESFKETGKDKASPRILHLATHGYFYPDPEGAVGSGQLAIGSGSLPAFKISDHPMIRSGLILAGGNHVWLGNPPPEGMEDGILTAYEISQMNLDSTELVVLSACETGLGDIDGNEGVYGLQRAFKIAGVQHIIMSLWSVPDQQTQEMMVAFYDHWLNKEMEIADAFRKAQQEMREKYEEHYYWAGFVLIE